MIRLHFPSVSVRLFRKPQKVLAFTSSQLRPLRRANSLETIVSFIYLFIILFFYGPSQCCTSCCLLVDQRLVTPFIITFWERTSHAFCQCPNVLFLLSTHFHLMDVSNDNICTPGREENNNPQIIGGSGKNKRKLSGQRLEGYIFTLI